MKLTAAWRRWHESNALARWSLKLAAFVLLTGLVLYPQPWRLPTWVQRISDLNSVLDPDHPGLAPLEEQVRAGLPPDASPRDALNRVQNVVYERLPYAWDWEVWGVMEWLPTVDEALTAGREDCDGRAVVAASLLRRMGYEATLATDILHMWVVTPQGETMNPTGGEKTLVGGDGRTVTNIVSPGVLQNVARGLTYGIGVFPLPRELLILLAMVVLTTHPWSSATRRVVGVLMLAVALAIFQLVGRKASMLLEPPYVAAAIFAAVLAAAGWLVLALRVRGRAAPPRSDGAPPV